MTKVATFILAYLDHEYNRHFVDQAIVTLVGLAFLWWQARR